MFYLSKGKVKTYRMNDDGKEYVTGLYKPGDFFGYMALVEDCNYTETAEVMEDAELYKIPKHDFLLLIQKNRDVAHKFVKMLSANVIQKEDELIKLAYNSIRKRVADALLLLRKRYMEENSEDQDFSISVSRDNLASIVGTATESVIRTLSEFKDDELIAINGRQISILDPEKLEKLPY
jgi:CRP-like cAMP-binding protein